MYELEATEEWLEGPETTLQQCRAIKEREKVTCFLLILNETYSPFRLEILAMDPMSSVGRIYQTAVQEESQQLAVVKHGRTREGVTLAAFSVSPISIESPHGIPGGWETIGVNEALGQRGNL